MMVVFGVTGIEGVGFGLWCLDFRFLGLMLGSADFVALGGCNRWVSSREMALLSRCLLDNRNLWVYSGYMGIL
jgi:hypothetical protein